MTRLRLLATIITAAVPLVGASPAGAAQRLMTDPDGDADSAFCGFYLHAPPPCRPTTTPVSQPAIDILFLDLAGPGRSLVADIGVLDLDHPVIGPNGSGPEDSSMYVVAFNVGDATINFQGERDNAGNVLRAQLVAGTGPSGGPTMPTRPIAVTYDAVRDRVRFEAALSDIDAALHEVCATCPTVARGTELSGVFPSTSVVDRDPIFGANVSASDVAQPAGRYVIGN